MRDESVPVIPGYDLLKLHVVGGTADTFRSWHLRLDRAVVIKCPKLGKDPGKFLVESRILARLRHTNIVQVYDAGISSPTPLMPSRAFMAMEDVAGGTLKERCGRLEDREPGAIRIARQLADALVYVHRQKDGNGDALIHRDIKPENVLMDGDTPKLADFGLSKFSTGDVDAGQLSVTSIGGTPGYQAPEQLDPLKRPNEATDVFCFGVTLVELVTGERPFSVGEQRDAEIRRGLPDNPLVSPPLMAVLRRCVQFEQDKRISSEHLLDRLRRLELGEPIDEHPEPIWRRTQRLFFSDPKTAWISGSLGVALLVAFFAAIIAYVVTADANAKLEVALSNEKAALVNEKAALAAARKLQDVLHQDISIGSGQMLNMMRAYELRPEAKDRAAREAAAADPAKPPENDSVDVALIALLDLMKTVKYKRPVMPEALLLKALRDQRRGRFADAIQGLQTATKVIATERADPNLRPPYETVALEADMAGLHSLRHYPDNYAAIDSLQTEINRQCAKSLPGHPDVISQCEWLVFSGSDRAQVLLEDKKSQRAYDSLAELEPISAMLPSTHPMRGYAQAIRQRIGIYLNVDRLLDAERKRQLTELANYFDKIDRESPLGLDAVYWSSTFTQQ